MMIRILEVAGVVENYFTEDSEKHQLRKFAEEVFI